jgi:acyl carrier protein
MSKVIELISSVLGVGVDINSDMEDINEWDSFNHVLIMIELKSEFKLNIKQEDFKELNTVKKIIEAIEKN